MKIEHKVYNERNKCNQTNMPADTLCIFTVKSFDGGFMAFVSTSYKTNSNDCAKLFEGNSLWNLGKMSESDLLNKIYAYNDIQSVIKDFSA